MNGSGTPCDVKELEDDDFRGLLDAALLMSNSSGLVKDSTVSSKQQSDIYENPENKQKIQEILQTISSEVHKSPNEDESPNRMSVSSDMSRKNSSFNTSSKDAWQRVSPPPPVQSVALGGAAGAATKRGVSQHSSRSVEVDSKIILPMLEKPFRYQQTRPADHVVDIADDTFNPADIKGPVVFENSTLSFIDADGTSSSNDSSPNKNDLKNAGDSGADITTGGSAPTQAPLTPHHAIDQGLGKQLGYNRLSPDYLMECIDQSKRTNLISVNDLPAAGHFGAPLQQQGESARGQMELGRSFGGPPQPPSNADSDMGIEMTELDGDLKGTKSRSAKKQKNWSDSYDLPRPIDYMNQIMASGLASGGGRVPLALRDNAIESNYSNLNFGRHSPTEMSNRPAGGGRASRGMTGKRKKSDTEKSVKMTTLTNNIRGHRGNQSLDSLLEYIEGESSKSVTATDSKSSKRSTKDTSNGVVAKSASSGSANTRSNPKPSNEPQVSPTSPLLGQPDEVFDEEVAAITCNVVASRQHDQLNATSPNIRSDDEGTAEKSRVTRSGHASSRRRQKAKARQISSVTSGKRSLSVDLDTAASGDTAVAMETDHGDHLPASLQNSFSTDTASTTTTGGPGAPGPVCTDDQFASVSDNNDDEFFDTSSEQNIDFSPYMPEPTPAKPNLPGDVIATETASVVYDEPLLSPPDELLGEGLAHGLEPYSADLSVEVEEFIPVKKKHKRKEQQSQFARRGAQSMDVAGASQRSATPPPGSHRTSHSQSSSSQPFRQRRNSADAGQQQTVSTSVSNGDGGAGAGPRKSGESSHTSSFSSHIVSPSTKRYDDQPQPHLHSYAQISQNRSPPKDSTSFSVTSAGQDSDSSSTCGGGSSGHQRYFTTRSGQYYYVDEATGRRSYAAIARQPKPHVAKLNDFVDDALFRAYDSSDGGPAAGDRPGRAASLTTSPRRPSSPQFSVSTMNQANASSPDLKYVGGSGIVPASERCFSRRTPRAPPVAHTKLYAHDGGHEGAVIDINDIDSMPPLPGTNVGVEQSPVTGSNSVASLASSGSTCATVPNAGANPVLPAAGKSYASAAGVKPLAWVKPFAHDHKHDHHHYLVAVPDLVSCHGNSTGHLSAHHCGPPNSVDCSRSTDPHHNQQQPGLVTGTCSQQYALEPPYCPTARVSPSSRFSGGTIRGPPLPVGNRGLKANSRHSGLKKANSMDSSIMTYYGGGGNGGCGGTGANPVEFLDMQMATNDDLRKQLSGVSFGFGLDDEMTSFPVSGTADAAVPPPGGDYSRLAGGDAGIIIVPSPVCDVTQHDIQQQQQRVNAAEPSSLSTIPENLNASKEELLEEYAGTGASHRSSDHNRIHACRNYNVDGNFNVDDDDNVEWTMSQQFSRKWLIRQEPASRRLVQSMANFVGKTWKELTKDEAAITYYSGMAK